MGFFFKVLIICFLTYYITESWFAVLFVGFLTSVMSTPDDMMDEKWKAAQQKRKERMDKVGADNIAEAYVFETLNKIFRKN